MIMYYIFTVLAFNMLTKLINYVHYAIKVNFTMDKVVLLADSVQLVIDSDALHVLIKCIYRI